MTFKDINEKYSNIIHHYMMNDYVINSTTMSGSQGEIAHIDLTNGKEIIRILVERFYSYTDYIDGVKIVVGKCTDKVTPHTNHGFNTIWNEHLELIQEGRFYESGVRGNDYFVDYDTAHEAQQKRNSRYKNKSVCNSKDFSDSVKAKRIVFNYLKRQPKCKSMKISDIESVKHILDANSNYSKYIVVAKGKEFVLNKKKISK